jgi:hypothetical protein
MSPATRDRLASQTGHHAPRTGHNAPLTGHLALRTGHLTFQIGHRDSRSLSSRPFVGECGQP